MSNSCPSGYENAPRDHFHDLKNSISVPGESGPLMRVIPGFDDLMPDKVLGAGKFLNTFGTVDQLCSAILLSSNPVVAEIYDQPEGEERDVVVERVRQLRESQVLDKLRILDLGCGRPAFALAATALGATVYTADLEKVEDKPTELTERHIQVNLRDINAVDTIKEVSGENLDMVTESIIDVLPWQPANMFAPLDIEIIAIANRLLRIGGNLTMLSGFTHNSTGYTRLEIS